MKRVVVIGGGFCGASVARELQDEFEVILVDDKPYFEYTPGILRIAVEPECANKLRIMHHHYLTRGRVVKGRVRSVGEKSVQVGRSVVAFDYLVVAGGAAYGATGSGLEAIPAYRGEDLEKHAEEVLHAGHILIIGGGLVGVELAAEIATKHPQKKITMVHMGKQIIERNHPKAIAYAEAFLRKYNVEIIYGEKVVKKERGIYFTDKGTRILADCVFACAGMSPNASFMDKQFLNERGAIKVNEHLRVWGRENVFAGGDVIDVKEEKTAQSAERHAEIIVKNIRAMEGERKLENYVIKKRPMLISLGKWDGILERGESATTGKIPALAKMFVEWKTLSRFK